MEEKNIYIRLANIISDLDQNTEGAEVKGSQHVRLLETTITQEQAAACLSCTKEFLPTEQLAERIGVKGEDIYESLLAAAVAGILYVKEIDGVDHFKLSNWMPGIMEHVLTNFEKNPETLDAFYELGPGEQVVEVFANAPMGGGIMRTIPIASAVEADSKIATYEQLQTYLDQSDFYTAVDCECKTAARLSGTACAHTYKDMCIQIGEEAEYYVRTGRAERKTREEIETLLKRAHRTGLVSSIFNNEGNNKTSMICNCCGDSCGILRNLHWLRVPDHSRSNFVSEIDPLKCVACGACVEICPMNAIKMGNNFCSIDSQVPKMERLPSDGIWPAEEFKPDYKKRILVNDKGTSPCKTQCPAHISIQGYIKKAAEGKFDEALKIIKRDNPFPAVCGRICPHTCENECSRQRVDEAIAIDDIKKFIADKELESGNRYIPEIFEDYDEKIAIIGGGPAGLTCAYYLAVEGYKITVFEKQKTVGGMLKNGLPSFRLEKDIVDAEIDVLREMGVEFKTGINVGTDITIPQLREDGFKAFYIAIGAQNGMKLGVEGEQLEGVSSGIDFLRDVNSTGPKTLSGNTLVIGGGNAAIDVARMAIRLGDSSVNMYCLETDEDMPTVPDEKDEALAEGIVINNCWGPKRILGENGKVTGVEFKRCLSVKDENGRFAPVYDDNDTVIVPCSNVFVSIGQSVNWGELLSGSKADPNGARVLKVADVTYQTAEEDIFGGGDAVTGPQFTIDAIASGKSGAISIHRFLQNFGLAIGREREFRPFDTENADYSSYEAMKRERPSAVDHKQATGTLDDLRQQLTEEQLAKEAKRCLGCGTSVVDPYMCIGCGLCTTKCEFDAAHLVRAREIGSAETPMDWGMNVMSFAMERGAKIAATQAAESEKAD